MMHTRVCAHGFDSPALKMHAIPFHTHIIKSPKSREIAPRRACPRTFSTTYPSHQLSNTHSTLFSLRSPLARSRTYTIPCRIGSLFNFVVETCAAVTYGDEVRCIQMQRCEKEMYFSGYFRRIRMEILLFRDLNNFP